MEINSKKLERTSKIVNFSIASVLCILLIALSNSIIEDIDDWSDRPVMQDFEDKALMDSINEQNRFIRNQIEEINAKNISIHKTIEIVQQNYENEKQSYENWLAARQTIGSPKEDKDVLARAKKLDEYYKIEQDWRKELTDNEKRIDILYQQQSTIQEKQYEAQEQADVKYKAAIRSFDLNVFLKRLLFAFPVLIVGIVFLIKFRQHKYWPVFLGFILFSIYVFFFGLVPYLPSYGGYIRYTVGILLSITLGIYAINKIRAFIEKKKAELKEASSERAKRVKSETAEKALNNHFCPSCGKDFILKKWDAPKKKEKNTEKELFNLVSNFCRHCGLELFSDCSQCGHKNYAHLPFCSNCGNQIIKDELVEN